MFEVERMKINKKRRKKEQDRTALSANQFAYTLFEIVKSLKKHIIP